ncbi:branched-chain amino acid ABC transporter permease [Virgisporangium aliadipatigenens]|uniref:Branched-chain amino acid ABC transporter permease n=1 Tax=Virgisporangium aliadipatigenens TaxID=741659 RepID=A0A8J3YNJ5_9ACTN|nr:branched-chain amino acid ABC transporter permease [Virgisporangium aliadipatigenens]GIJ47702.1 branched-chain amino acid ABC transporter permease [Virgisporangium aliadipatigenens]
MNIGELLRSFPELTVTGVTQGAIYALVALGYTLVYGVLRLINFAHSEVFMVGTFAALFTWGLFGLDSNTERPSIGVALLAILAAIVVAAVTSAAVALLIEVTAYRPLRHRNAPPLAFLITAIGASFVLMEVAGSLTVRRPFGVPALLPSKPLFDIGGWAVTPTQVTTVVVAIAMLVGLDYFVQKTRAGRGIRAVAQDPNTAALMGVNKSRVIALVFILGGLMAGVAAVFNDIKTGSTKFNVGFLLGLKAFSAAVLGGIGNLRGAALGGLLLGLIENYASALFGSNWRDFVAFVALIALLMFRPTGLLGESLGRARA